MQNRQNRYFDGSLVLMMIVSHIWTVRFVSSEYNTDLTICGAVKAICVVVLYNQPIYHSFNLTTEMCCIDIDCFIFYELYKWTNTVILLMRRSGMTLTLIPFWHVL